MQAPFGACIVLDGILRHIVENQQAYLAPDGQPQTTADHLQRALEPWSERDAVAGWSPDPRLGVNFETNRASQVRPRGTPGATRRLDKQTAHAPGNGVVGRCGGMRRLAHGCAHPLTVKGNRTETTCRGDPPGRILPIARGREAGSDCGVCAQTTLPALSNVVPKIQGVVGHWPVGDCPPYGAAMLCRGLRMGFEGPTSYLAMGVHRVGAVSGRHRPPALQD